MPTDTKCMRKPVLQEQDRNAAGEIEEGTPALVTLECGHKLTVDKPISAFDIFECKECEAEVS